jgi:hypothetical protein
LHNFQNCPFELREFIEEQHTVLSKGNFSGLWEGAATDERNV